MNVKLHVDFCFVTPCRRVVAVGWSPDEDLLLMIHGGAVSFPATRLSRFARRDLRTVERLGFLAVFDFSSYPDTLNILSEDVILAAGHEHSYIGSDRFLSDALSMVEIGVDEAFFSLLRLYAEGYLMMPEAQLSSLIVQRICAAEALPGEAETHAVATDRGLIAASGQGVATGWYLHSTSREGALLALAFDNRQLVRVKLIEGVVKRPDLESYADRYIYTERDGWLASFRFGGPTSGEAKLLLIVPGQLAVSGVIFTLQNVGKSQVARLLIEARLMLEDSAQADALHCATLGSPSFFPELEFSSNSMLGDAPLLLVLDHDLAGPDLRDVIRRLSQATGRAIRLHLLRDAVTPDLSNAIEGAIRESAQAVELFACSLLPPKTIAGPALLVFARSSVLFHLLKHVPAAGEIPNYDLKVLALDVLANLPGGAGQAATRFDTDRPAFLCWGDAERLIPMLTPLMIDTLAPESAFRLLTRYLIDAGRVLMLPADATGFHAGTRGPFAAPLIEGVSTHDFDALSARLSKSAQL